MGNPEYIPRRLVLLFPLVGCRFRVFHLVGEVEECVLDLFKALWGGLLGAAGAADGGHGACVGGCCGCCGWCC